MLNYPDIAYWIAAANLKEIGPNSILQVVAIFKNIKNFFSASDAELALVGVKLSQIVSIRSINWVDIMAIVEWCEQNQCFIISFADKEYPPLLRHITNPPLVLFVMGNKELLNRPQLAMVGSRNPSVMGQELAFRFAAELNNAGFLITSGLALGIDAASHQGAMESGGNTLAVLGSGFHFIYPAINRKLAKKIIENGALISEFIPSEMPKAKNFPRRNRIISGLSLGVLVVEASVRSGSLITARLASEQGREVFAIPHSIHNPLARGCHQLIRNGAKLVECVADILEEIKSLSTFISDPIVFFKENEVSVAPINLSSENLGPSDLQHTCNIFKQALIKEPSAISSVKSEEKSPKGRRSHSANNKINFLLECVDYTLTPLELIIKRSGLTIGEVSSMLLKLELKGAVQNISGGYIKGSASSLPFHSNLE